MNRFYVYAHIRKSTGEVFYIGRGTGKRMYSKQHRSKHWQAIVNKYGIDHKILFNNLTNEGANVIEQEQIKEYGRLDNGGQLINQTDGGGGLCGYKPTKETLIKKSKAMKGRIFKHIDKNIVEKMFMSGSTIKQIASIQKVAITTIRKHIDPSIRFEHSKKGKSKENLIMFNKGNIPWNKGVTVFSGVDNPFYGKKHSQDELLKMSEAKRKPVICLTDGKIYGSTIEAAEQTGLNQSSIAKVARGYQKITKGFVFKYLPNETN